MAEHLPTDEKSPLTISDLPVDILEGVVGTLNLLDCLTLRKVSHNLCNLVDSSTIHCQGIEFNFEKNCSKIKFEEKNLELKCEEKEDGCEVYSRSEIFLYKDDRDFKKVMLADVSTFLGNPKLEIGRLVLTGDVESCSEFLDYLKSLKSPLNVRSVQTEDMALLGAIFPFLRPEFLKEIIFDPKKGLTIQQLYEISKTDGLLEILKSPTFKITRMRFDDYSDASLAKFLETLELLDSQLLPIGIVYIFDRNDGWIIPVLRALNADKLQVITLDTLDLTIDQFDEIVAMEEVKRKTKLRWCHFPDGVALGQLLRFKAIQSTQFDLSDENLVVIRDNLLKSPHLDLCQLQGADEFDENLMYEKLDRIMSEAAEYDAETRRLRIPNSGDHFQMGVQNHGRCLVIVKINN